MTFEAVQRIADAVLYEGYLLYPYRAGSSKDRVRFQFGVVMPRAFALGDGSESVDAADRVPIELTTGADGRPMTPRVDVRVRALQLQARAVEVADVDAVGGFRPAARIVLDGEELVPWDEAVEAVIDLPPIAAGGRCARRRRVPVHAGRRARGRARARQRRRDHGAGRPDPLADRGRDPTGRPSRRGDPSGCGSCVENRTPVAGAAATRDIALRQALLGCHTLLAVRDGAFISLTDPGDDPAAQDVVRRCHNDHTWPVLAGEEGRRDLVLSSPIILADHPAIAPESQGDLFDGTEIDEILTLRIMTLTDEEKAAARATDLRARAIVDAADSMPPELLDRLHGAIRYLRAPGGDHEVDRDVERAPDEPVFPTWTTPPDGPLPVSVWEPEARVAPELATVLIDGVPVSKGSVVRLQPTRRADAFDFFLRGRLATVEAIFETVDDDVHVAVTLPDDPATDLHREAGRYFYFTPDELRLPVPAAADAGR